MKKPQMFMPFGQITIEGNAEAVEALVFAINQNETGSIATLAVPELDEDGLPIDGGVMPMKPALVEVDELDDGQARSRFAFQGTKLQTEYLINESLAPANWWHPRNDATDWFWVFIQHQLIAGDDYTINVDWIGRVPEEELISDADDLYES